jgi:transcription-repair coupling factor (superfamily II helicase)
MKFFEDQLINIIEKTKTSTVSLAGCSPENLLFLLEQFSVGKNTTSIWLSPLQVRQNLSRHSVDHIFVWDKEFYDPTDQVLNHEALLNLLCKLYDILLFDKGKQCFIPWEIAFLKLPDPQFFKNHSITIQSEDIIPQNQLKERLMAIGYEEGKIGSLQLSEFCFRGDVCDIKTAAGKHYRLIYFDELVEHMYLVDAETNRVIKDKSLPEINIIASWKIFLKNDFLNILRENIPVPTPQFRNKFDYRKEFFQSLQNHGASFSIYYLPMFYTESPQYLLQYLKNWNVLQIGIYPDQQLPAIESQFNLWQEKLEQHLIDENNSNLFPRFDKIFHLPKTSSFDSLFRGIYLLLQSDQQSLGSWKDLNILLKPLIEAGAKRLSKVELFIKWFKSHQDQLQNIYLCYSNEEEKENLLAIVNNRWSFLKDSDSFSLKWIKAQFIVSCYEEITQSLILSAKDYVYTSNTKQKASARHVDLFAEHLSTLKEGDFVVHQGFGIGKFVEMQNMTVAGQNSDFIVLKFLDDDKVYVPVYKMNLLEKYADTGAHVKLSDLKTKKFEQEKQNARASAKKLAFDLLRLEAERKSHKGFAFSPPDEYFEEFESSFPFDETPDQAQAIKDVIDDMCKPTPMDRLVCGDVGFGKTEVAMRAAFKAILDKKQVVILVPTTILCLQHFNNFKRRFSSFGVNICQLSRLNTTKETKEALDKLKSGQCDLVVATHKILSKDVVFHDLGLVIVDEEHRFGVGDKEKLKLLRSNTDFLTLTATPIPRTLQLAFLGIKPLSLIQTPPPERQTIQTLLIREDWETIQSAIKRELKRNGQVFYIYNRVIDIEIMASKIKEVVPEASLVIAHGQLNETDLEKRIQGFYEKKYDILLATTIVESGIDIPIANTMIIHNAHSYGLAQLHQLRGRIGRSNTKAYCYFVIPDKHQLTELSSKRLEALQKYCDIGAGFALANSDLEIRGAGELLGAEQSGHIQSIGLELYLSLLEEAMKEIKGEISEVSASVDVSLGLSCYIPQNYIQEEGARIKFYKKLANATDQTQLNQISEEINDIYGPIPEFVNNLILTLKMRLLIKPLCLKQISLAKESLLLRFDTASLEKKPKLSQALVQYFLAKPKLFKFHSPTQVDYKPNQQLTPQAVLDFCQNLKDQVTST